jgi:lipocalin
MKSVLATLAIAALATYGIYDMYTPDNAIDFVTDLDVERFMGRWYVIASKPNLIEKNCKCGRSDDTLVDEKTITLAETCWIFGKSISRL